MPIDSQKIEFIQYHQPVLKDGNYTLKITQKVKTQESSTIPEETFQIQRQFSVLGPRFCLNPTDVQAIFPPKENLGLYYNTLSHIVFNRTTLPWERQAKENDEILPWLVLLVFDETEKPLPSIITLQELQQINTYPAKFPEFHLEPGQHLDDRVMVIDVQKRLLEKIMPRVADLPYLAHIRQAIDAEGKVAGKEQPVIIANRLPKDASRTTVHLVSIENRFENNGFDYQGASESELIRLVSLHSWSFSSIKEQETLQGFLKNCNYNPGTLQLPPVQDSTANTYLQKGFLPLKHQLRNGGKTVSWYHGPWITGDHQDIGDLALPAQTSDELLRYQPNDGMFDVSYAAAWELGRLLALQDKKFSTELYQWKRTHAQQLKKAEQHLLHLPGSSIADVVQFPESLAAWFYDHSLLKGIPFNYLVPNEKMLPKESIRFLYIEPAWVYALLDGAFSIGRVTTADYTRDQQNQPIPFTNLHEQVSGFLLRSEAVAGWPGLLVEGYAEIVTSQDFDHPNHQLDLLRMDRISHNTLVCLFAGDVQTIDIHLKPETLHFGFDLTEETEPRIYKKLRDSEGQQDSQKISAEEMQGLWQGNANDHVLNISGLANAISNKEDLTTSKSPQFTSAQFALEMIEGTQKVRFTKRP